MTVVYNKDWPAVMNSVDQLKMNREDWEDYCSSVWADSLDDLTDTAVVNDEQMNKKVDEQLTSNSRDEKSLITW